MVQSIEAKPLCLDKLQYKDINVKLINSIKNSEDLIEVINIWKRGAEGLPLKHNIVTIKLAIYQHFLYPKCRHTGICLINHIYT